LISRTRFWLILLLLVSASTRSYADIALLLQEPYGRFGSLNPTGHAAVYLTRICAASPTILRRCVAGETGVVISRYHGIGGFDWIAIPLMPYLYAVEQADQVPAFADADMVASLRDQYRVAHLQEMIPDEPGGTRPKGVWIELVGAAYDRQIVGFKIDTTEAQDDELIQELNARPNNGRFNLLFRNCADFARDIVNIYYPKALRSNFIADLGITTPKQIAKSLVRYSDRQPVVHLSAFMVAQIPGSRPQSKGVHGVLESLVKSKKYIVPLIAVQPWLSTGLVAGYLTAGRFNPDQYAATVYDPEELEQRALLATESRSLNSPTERFTQAHKSESERSLNE
jgi:hypothetical protein